MNLFTKAAGLTGMLLALLPGRALAEAKPTSGPAIAGPLSVFVNHPGFGKDPFFPKSTRVPVVKTNDVIESFVAPPPAVPDEILLKGINLLKDRRFCILNNRTVTAGEEFDLKLKGKVYKVRCVEIRDKSVVISVNGMSKELPLRNGL
jgi:hypothetical protein